ncbi:MAG: SpoIIE family protein phosphatase [Methanobrevibacter sp.]|nr:SpoIIE family protein phosphatase [Methanobrevibacter sp.]
MLRKLFKNNKLFIFIFTFCVEFIVYYFFNHLNVGGRFLIPDMALSPLFGLMFGPIGGLGQASATLVSELKAGCNIGATLIDFSMLLFISILPYKLWYMLSGDRLTTPRFDSIHNILKFLFVMFLTSGCYLMLLRVSFLAFPDVISDIYSISNFKFQFSYAFNIFDFSIIYGLIFINVFNILKIPLRKPNEFKFKFHIRHRYFLIPFAILIAYIALGINIDIFNYFMFFLAFISAFLFCINSFEVDEVEEPKYYSILEKIAIGFLIIMGISFLQLFDELSDMGLRLGIFSGSYNDRFIFMVSLGIIMILATLFTMVHIYFVERIITRPINELNSSIKNYVNDGNLSKQKHVDFKFKSLLKNKDDITVLIDSFNKLTGIIRQYLNNLKQTTIEKERYETEFNVARNIQSNMLSLDFDDFSKGRQFEIYALMNPAREVGGDFYDYFDIDEDNIGFVIGDVSGKGIPASLFMVKIMYLIKNHSKFNKSACEIISHVNKLSCEKNESNLFVTSWFGKLNFKSGKLSFVNAGHNYPFIMQNDGEFESLKSYSNIVLGIMDDAEYKESEIILSPGDTIFLYTDGVTEANNDYNGFYGEDRLKNILNKYKGQELNKTISEIKNDIDEFCNSQEQFDDITMFIIRYRGIK